jgi:transcriptional regulator with XRE-family HTH domain
MEQKKTNFAVALGKNIRLRRIELGFNQEELASKVGVEPNSISRIECGTHLPSLERLDSIALALGVTLSALLGAASSNHLDQIESLQGYLQGLESDERSLILAVVKQQSDFFKARTKARKHK